MNCAWCCPSENGSDGICDDCMLKYFGIDPESIHEEIEQEAAVALNENELVEVAQ